MSAFIVQKQLIDSIVQYTIEHKMNLCAEVSGHMMVWDMQNIEDVNEVGQYFLDTNQYSVNYRYNEKEIAEKYQYVPVNRKYTTNVQIYKFCLCLDYQSCEFPEWKRSQAFYFLCQIKDAIMYDMIGKTAEYESAKWDF
jgi:hypothetical protein